MKKFLVIFLLFSTCSVVDEDAFFSKAVGTYTINSTGVRFLKKITGLDISTGDTLTFSGNATAGGTLSITTTNSETEESVIITLATLIELQKPYQGVFKFNSITCYVAMGLEESMWISTTNAKSSPYDVLFEHLVPIATSTD